MWNEYGYRSLTVAARKDRSLTVAARKDRSLTVAARKDRSLTVVARLRLYTSEFLYVE
jgi:hypothetical protein